jgi:hypothetical protein
MDFGPLARKALQSHQVENAFLDTKLKPVGSDDEHGSDTTGASSPELADTDTKAHEADDSADAESLAGSDGELADASTLLGGGRVAKQYSGGGLSRLLRRGGDAPVLEVEHSSDDESAADEDDDEDDVHGYVKQVWTCICFRVCCYRSRGVCGFVCMGACCVGSCNSFLA